MTLVQPTSSNIALTDVGVRFTDTTTVDEWAEFGDRLERADRGLRWIIGDWLVYGSERFGARAVVIADSLNLSTGSVANAASVCRRVPFERRRPELSFSHHEEVAHLDGDGQERMLATAVREGLSKSVLRQLIGEEDRTRKDSTPAVGKPSTSSPSTASTSTPDAADTSPSPQQGPITVTYVLAGELPADRALIDDGLDRVREGLEAWFGGHGYSTTVEIR